VLGAPHDERRAAVVGAGLLQLGLQLADPGLQGLHLVLQLEHLAHALEADAEGAQRTTSRSRAMS
jgi:hypothetical protein